MESRSSLWQLLTLTVYTGLVVVVAWLASWSLSLSLVFLCGVPVIVLLYERPLALSSLLSALGIGGVMLSMIGAVGQTTGAWYGVTASNWQWYGVTFENILFSFVHALYLIVLYEFFFDDGKAGSRVRRHVLPTLCVLMALLLSFVYLFYTLVVSFAFAWLLVVLLATTLITLLLVHPAGASKLLGKVAMFALLVWPLSLAIELVALAQGSHIFAFSSEYLGVLNLFGLVIPFEQLILLFLWPLMLGIVYELFVDDAS